MQDDSSTIDWAMNVHQNANAASQDKTDDSEKAAHSPNTGANNITNSSMEGNTNSKQAVEQISSSRAVWVIRLIFLFFLVGVAVSLGVSAFYIISSIEDDLGNQQYDALVIRALDLAEELALRRRVGVNSMAQVASAAFPNVDEWPNVAIPAFETTSHDLINTSGNIKLGFYPMVQPEAEVPGEQSSFENFAYDYYYNVRDPPFPQDVASHNFGRGIWAANNAWRYRDETGETLKWDSQRRALFPEFQTSDDTEAGRSTLMYNVHQNPLEGEPLDEVIECSLERKAKGDPEKECGTVTHIFPWNRNSFLAEPIYPANDNLELTGVIMSQFSWDLTLQRIFRNTYDSGLYAILEAEGGSFSYLIDDGAVEFIGEGDLHDTDFDEYARSITLSGEGVSGASLKKYVLTVYPSGSFFHSYRTSNPKIATIGAVAIVVLTSLIFILYDLAVRREFSARLQLLHAKRKFVRFISHEVRTPLNAVCMGLTLLEEDLAQAIRDLANAGTRDIENQVSSERDDRIRKENALLRNLDEWFSLTKDVHESARGSVGILDDLLNFDKVESGTLSMELTVFPICGLIRDTFKEFRLSAQNKKLDFKLDCLPNKASLWEERNFVGDSVRIAQIIRNLISNAIKFTPEGGKITVSLCSRDSQEQSARRRRESFQLNSGEKVTLEIKGNLEISVTDTGVGLSPVQQDSMFQSGVQFNVNQLQAGGGSGLGLFISRGIARQHRGDLSVKSPGIDQGTTFICTLPLYDVPVDRRVSSAGADAGESAMFSQSIDSKCDDVSLKSTAESTVPQIPREPRESVGAPHENTETTLQTQSCESASLRILVVDDVKSNRKLLVRLVKKHGHNVDDACDGRTAVDMVARGLEEGWSYDAILMDHEMPILKGPEATKEIRGLGCGSFVIGVTGNVLAEDVNYFMSCGANHVLPKPVDFKRVEDLLVEHGIYGLPFA